MALPTRFATTWPIRCGSCRIRSGVAGTWIDRLDAALARGGRGLLDRVLDGRAEVVRAQVEQDEARNRAWTAPGGSGPASRAARSAARSTRGTRPAASGSSPACSLSRSLNVRSAAIGVRSSCETSARKSRLRSRSRRMISTLSWTRSAIVLNWAPSSTSSEEPGAHLRRRDALREVALGEGAGRLRELAERRREPAGQRRRHDHAQAEGEERDGREQAGDVGDGGRPVRVRVGEADVDDIRREDVAHRCTCAGRP